MLTASRAYLLVLRYAEAPDDTHSSTAVGDLFGDADLDLGAKDELARRLAGALPVADHGHATSDAEQKAVIGVGGHLAVACEAWCILRSGNRAQLVAQDHGESGAVARIHEQRGHDERFEGRTASRRSRTTCFDTDPEQVVGRREVQAQPASEHGRRVGVAVPDDIFFFVDVALSATHLLRRIRHEHHGDGITLHVTEARGPLCHIELHEVLDDRVIRALKALHFALQNFDLDLLSSVDSEVRRYLGLELRESALEVVETGPDGHHSLLHDAQILGGRRVGIALEVVEASLELRELSEPDSGGDGARRRSTLERGLQCSDVLLQLLDLALLGEQVRLDAIDRRGRTDQIGSLGGHRKERDDSRELHEHGVPPGFGELVKDDSFQRSSKERKPGFLEEF